MSNRDFNLNNLREAIKSYDPDGIAQYFASLLDFLFFGPRKDGSTQVPVPPEDQDWKGWVPLACSILDLFDPDLCPSRFLPYLARLAGVDVGLLYEDDQQNEVALRQLIKDAVSFARVKGVPASVLIFFRALGWNAIVEQLWLNLKDVGGEGAPPGREAKAWPPPPDPQPDDGYWFDRKKLKAGSPDGSPPDNEDPWRRINQIDIILQRIGKYPFALNKLESLKALLEYVLPVYVLIRSLGVGEFSEDEFDISSITDGWGKPAERDPEFRETRFPFPQNGRKVWYACHRDFVNYVDRTGDQVNEYGMSYQRKGVPRRDYPIPYEWSRPLIKRDGYITDRWGKLTDEMGLPYYHIEYPAITYIGCTQVPPTYWPRDELVIDKVAAGQG